MAQPARHTETAPAPARAYSERPSRIPGAVVWQSRTLGPSSQRILPDGCMDVLWGNETLSVAGPDTEAHLFTATAPTTVTGLRFAPGMLPALLGVPASDLLNQRVDLAELLPRARVDALLRALESAASLDTATASDTTTGAATAAALEAAWLPEVDHAARANPAALSLTAAALHLTRAGHSAAATARTLDLSERQLHRRSVATFGYGLRTLGRVLRLQDAVAAASRTPGIPLSRLAAEAGYADQSHFTRDFRGLAGVTPREFLGTHA